MTKTKIQSPQHLSIILSHPLPHPDYQQPITLPPTINLLTHHITPLPNKGPLYQTPLKMQQQPINLTLLTRSIPSCFIFFINPQLLSNFLNPLPSFLTILNSISYQIHVHTNSHTTITILQNPILINNSHHNLTQT
ncbi:YqaH family protein, partial [Bacillus subtilis]|uniref:YqaH family protein n=1 Tax=Bacillus subtilis TaxID=1423 RepID=UPI002575FDB4